MHEQPMLVIVIPTRNRRALLERALRSVFDQSYPRYRVVLVDDGSTDDTPTYIDSIGDSRVQRLRHEKSKGVNAARNIGFRSLREGEWAVPLDDDDFFLPEAFEVIAQSIDQTPGDVPILQFPTVIESRDDVYQGGGVAFTTGQACIEPTYEEVMTSFDFGGRGESRVAFKWTLFPKYLFNEDINGYEGEWWLLVQRDGIRNRFVNTPPIVRIDWRHEGEHLSDTAARDNPASFARACKRVLQDHAAFFVRHPDLIRQRGVVALKVAIRARDPVLTTYFLYQYTKATVRLALSKAPWHY